MSRRFVALAALALALTLGVAVPRARARADARALMTEAKERLAAREYQKARDGFGRLLAETRDPDLSDEARLLVARAFLLEGKPNEAVTAARALIAARADSPLAAQARYVEAQALLRAGKAREAAALLEERAMFLSGPARRGELAQGWLALGDEAFTPPAPAGQPAPAPDLSRALDAYLAALALGADAVGARRDEVRLRMVECLARLNKHADVLDFLPFRGETALAPALQPRALLLEAESFLALGRADEARAVLKRLEAEHGDAPEAALAVERLGDSWAPTAPATPVEARQLGIAQWQRFLARYPAHGRAPAVVMKLADAHVMLGRLDDAIGAWRGYVERWADGADAGEARFRTGDALARLERYPEARAALGEFLGKHPSHPRFLAAQEGISASWIEQGERARARASFDDAAAAWRAFLEAYPVHARAPEVERRLGELLHEHGRTDEALAAWRTVADRYPRTQHGADALLRVAQVLEQKGDLAATVSMLEQVTQRFQGLPAAYAAAQQLATLRKKELRLDTRSARTTAEGAALRLTTRNVPRLELKAWKLDVVEYFKKKQHVGGIEQVAVDVVKPDATWTFELEGYEPFRKVEQWLPLPALKGPGAWIVVAEEDDFRAQTLVIVSDLTTVVKRAARQVLVLAIDEKTGAPAPGVEVLVSDGGRVVARGQTGQDGVLSLEDGDLPQAGHTNVLAARQGSVAFDEGVGGGSSAFGYSAKAWAFTDRPVYRPGAVVRWKAIVRHVGPSGTYALPANTEARVSVTDPRGVRLVQEDRRTSAWGALQGELELGDEPPLGDYQVTIDCGDAHGVATFAVEAYKKPEVVVEVTPAQSSVLAGEEVKATIAARTYYGGVVADAPVTWTVTRRAAPFDRESHKGFSWFYEATRGEEHDEPRPGELVARGEGTTDADGALAIAFPTEPLDQDCAYAIAVTTRGLDRRPVFGGADVAVTTRGFHAIVTAEARVVRAGRPVTVLVETVDARHQGLAVEGAVLVVRRASSGAEEVVDTKKLATDARGQGQLAVTLPRAGEWLLRFVARDRRGGVVEDQALVVVEGVADDTAPRASLRADREVYRRGDVARVLVEVPAAGRPALFTCEGERVLSYRVLRPGARAETIEVELEDAHAPNVFFKLAAPFDHMLHVAEDQVLVFKYLDVTVRAAKPVYGPGEEVVLEVEARDHAGAPVEAELALAVVDEAVFAIKPDRTRGAKPFFYDQRRVNSVSAGSSIDWSYDGITQAQRRELQAEREERELAGALEQEKADRALSLESRRRGAGAPAPAAPAPPPASEPAPMESPMMDEAMSGEFEGRGGGFASGGGQQKAAAAAEPPRRRFADTALWSPTVVTGKDGKATVRLRIPDDLTTWRVTARGATKETLVGDARASFRTSKPLVVTLALPRVVTERDAYQAGAIVDNRTGAEARGAVSVEADGKRTEKAFALPTGGAARFDAPGPVGAPGTRTVVARAATTTGEAQQDAIERTVEVVAVGLPERRGDSGPLEARAVASFDLPADRVRGTARLVVRLSPDGPSSILDGLQWLDAFPYGCVEQTVSRFLPLVAARDVLLASGLPADAVRARLDQGVRRGVRRLVDLQQPSGGFGWWKDDPASAALTAYALLGLARASQQGAFVDPSVLERARQAATRFLRGVGEDHDARALLVHALTASGASRQALQDDLNRLTRVKDGLAAQSLALLALARAQANEGAADLLATLRSRAVRKDGGASWSRIDRRGWGDSDAEATAWAGLALLAGAPDDPLVAEAAAFLRARQTAEGAWRSTRESAAALLFLAAHTARARGAAYDRKLTVTLNGAEVLATRVRGALGPAERTLVLDDDRLKDGKNELVLVTEGAGAARWQARLTWLRRSEDLPAGDGPITVARELTSWADPALARALPQHASIVKGAVAATTVTRLAVGERAWLRVALDAREALPFAIVEVPLPGGVEVVDPAPVVERGRCDRVEVRDDRATLFLTELPAGGATVKVLVQAVTPGRFLLLPARAELMYEPEVHGRSAGASLDVTAEPAARAPTPDERLLEARRLLGLGDLAAARPLLEGLLPLDLVPEARGEVLLALVRVALRTDDAPLATRSFEALRDHDPRNADRLVTPVERRDLARAYQRAGESQRAAAMLLDVLHGLFAEEATLADAHRALGRPARSQDALRRVLRDYPDTDPIVAGWFRLATAWFDVPRPAKGPRPKHWKPEGASADVMLEEAYLALEDFCAYFPTSPLAPQANSRAVEALERLGDDDAVARAALAFSQRYAGHELTDDVLIRRLRALTRSRRWDDAFACGRLILAHRERRDARTVVESPFKDEVTHTFARIHHERGELDQAVALYAQVAHRIPDARDAHAHLTAADLALPEVVRCAPGEDVALPLRSKNVASFAFRVYPVDLVVLFLTRMSLEGIHAVDLTGIAPLLEREVALGAATDHAWRDARVPLPVKEPGTYLVVGKAGDLDKSTLVVVSDLQVELQRAQQRARVYVTTRAGAPAAGVRVRVTDGRRLVARGTTDGRGVFEGVVAGSGKLSVLVEREGHVALLRE
jgi:uncharacterized protein YfaS (alpha-2-macroglobulin family)/TolA-binding protein